MMQLINDLIINETDIVAGVDEAGRGPLAGPVIAAAVILDPDKKIDQVSSELHQMSYKPISAFNIPSHSRKAEARVYIIMRCPM